MATETSSRSLIAIFGNLDHVKDQCVKVKARDTAGASDTLMAWRRTHTRMRRHLYVCINRLNEYLKHTIPTATEVSEVYERLESLECEYEYEYECEYECECEREYEYECECKCDVGGFGMRSKYNHIRALLAPYAATPIKSTNKR